MPAQRFHPKTNAFAGMGLGNVPFVRTKFSSIGTREVPDAIMVSSSSDMANTLSPGSIRESIGGFIRIVPSDFCTPMAVESSKPRRTSPYVLPYRVGS